MGIADELRARASALGFELAIAQDLTGELGRSLAVALDSYEERARRVLLEPEARRVALPPGLFMTPDAGAICDLFSCVMSFRRSSTAGWWVGLSLVPHLVRPDGAGRRAARHDAQLKGWVFCWNIRARYVATTGARLVSLARELLGGEFAEPDHNAHVGALARFLRTPSARRSGRLLELAGWERRSRHADPFELRVRLAGDVISDPDKHPAKGSIKHPISAPQIGAA